MVRKFTTPTEVLDGMPTPVEPSAVRFDPARRRAFGSVPKLLGETALGVADYRDLAPEIIMEVGVGSLRESLTPGHLKYEEQRRRYVVEGLALNATEYKTILRAREPSAMEGAADAGTESANEGLVSPLRIQEKQLKGRRDMLKSKGIRHANVMKSLAAEIDNLYVLQGFVATPGFARTTELDIRDRASKAWHLSFRNILTVVGRQRSWSPEQMAAAQQAMSARLSTGPQRDRVQYGEELIGLSLDYAKMRHALFAQRKNKIAASYLVAVAELTTFLTDNDLQPST